MIKVCIQGLGFVGAAMATVVSSKLDNKNPIYDVFGIDLDTREGRKRIDSINNGEFPFLSNDKKLLNEFNAAFKKGNLKASSDIVNYETADIIIISTNCDLITENGVRKIDLESFKLGIYSLANLVKEEVLIIVESTVPPGTCEKIIKPIFKESFASRNLDFNKLFLAHSYERVMPGKNYFNSIINYWRVYAGINKKSSEKCKLFLSTIINVNKYPLKELKNTTSSETAKVLENSYRAVNIAFMEEWGRFAEDVNIDLFEILDAIRFRPTHNNIRQPGFGVGGYCLTKDPLFAKIAAKEILNVEGHDFFFSTHAVKVNNDMPLVSLSKISNFFNNNIKNKNILIMGFTYRQDIGDTRYSPSEVFAKHAIESGAKIDAFDPLVSNWEEVPSVDVMLDLPNTFKYDIIIFCVAHKDFLEIDLSEWVKNKKTLIFDANNVLSENQRLSINGIGNNFLSIGRGS